MRTLPIVITATVLAIGPWNGPQLASAESPEAADSRHSHTQTAAKDIFFRPFAGPSAGQGLLALNYKILLKHGDRVVLVPPHYTFKHGDRFRLAIQTNANGYLYLLHRGSTGGGRFLFPDVRIEGGRNCMAAYVEHLVPASGWFEFDGNPGSECVHVILASDPLAQLVPLIGVDPIPASRWRQIVEAFVQTYHELQSERGMKDIFYVDPGNESAQADPAGSDALCDAPQAGHSTYSTIPGARPTGDREAASGASFQPNGHAVQVFVSQAAAPAGDGRLLVHTISLNHE